MPDSDKDTLCLMFELRAGFINALRKEIPESYPELPIDIGEKKNQQFCRDLALKGVEEMFEALQHLKNWKSHKITEDRSFDKEAFLEEIVDAFNYFLSLLIMTGFNSNDLLEAYLKKDRKIHDRLKNKY